MLYGLQKMNMYKTHLDNQLSCKLQPQQDHQGNVQCLHHKLKENKLDFSIEILARMTLSIDSILPMVANFRVKLKKKMKQTNCLVET